MFYGVMASSILDATGEVNSMSSCSEMGDSPVHKASVLSDEEALLTDSFLEMVNVWNASRFCKPISRTSGIKFLMARKFNVKRSFVLYQQHELMRCKEGVISFDPESPILSAELFTGKFTILPSKDINGATIALFDAYKHDPSQVTHQTTLQSVVYQLDVATENIETQRCGLVFVYNMSGSRYSNFDYELSQKILTLLKGAYPARLKKVLIVTAPLWFRAPFRLLRLFVREKLRDRVHTVSIEELALHIHVEALPVHLGGKLNVDHEAWLSHCRCVTVNNLENALLIAKYTEPFVENFTNLIGEEHLNSLKPIGCTNGLSKLQILPTTNDYTAMVNTNGDRKKIKAPTLHEGAMSLAQFIKHMQENGHRGLAEEYVDIKSVLPVGTFNVSRSILNQCRNRYTDVLSFDHSRVKLLDEIDGSDYINANFVDGFQHQDAYISTQGPLPNTFESFWQMVWEQNASILVMTTKVLEGQRIKCGQYWPTQADHFKVFGRFEIVCMLEDQKNPYFTETKLLLTNHAVKTDVEVSRSIYHLQFLNWPDYGVPQSAESFLSFRQRVNTRRIESGVETAPIIVHCSAGIGRTGTFCTIDTAINQFESTNTVSIRRIVERIRLQRAFSIQVVEQYIFCHTAFLQYLKMSGKLPELDWSNLDNYGEDYS